MKHQLAITLILLLAAMQTAFARTNTVDLAEKYNKQPLLFTQNKGQVADMNGSPRPDVLFTAHSKGVKLFFTKNGISYQFQKKEYPDGYNKKDKEKILQLELEKQIKTTTYRMDMELVGASLNSVIETKDKNDYYENFYLPQCPNGLLNVPTFSKVIYKEVYPKIDWIVYSVGQEMKYDFIVHPGGDPLSIKVKYNGATQTKINEDGSLLIVSPLGQIIDKKPESFQNRAVITSSFKINDGVIGYQLGDYDSNIDLIIDPGLVWATYYGGSGDEVGSLTGLGVNNIATDVNGNVYLGGTTESTNNIAAGGFHNTYSGTFGTTFLVKFNSSGSRFWGTYYGGDFAEAYAVTTDLNGNVFLAGVAYSYFIASGGFQNTFGGNNDASLIKFDSNGGRLWATYYGGSNSDYGRAVATDASGNVYLAGVTKSTSGIASGGYQVSIGGSQDVFLVKFNSNGNRLWGTYFGGVGDESCYNNCIAVDANYNVFLAGGTSSSNNISSGGFQNIYGGGGDAFLVKFNSSGNKLWGTYYGGSDPESGMGTTVDINGNIYMVGDGSTFGYRTFMVKFSTAGVKLWELNNYPVYGTTYEDVITDQNDNVYVTGQTSNSNISTGGYQSIYGGGNDAFIAKFTNAGVQIGATYFGGTNSEKVGGMAVDNNGLLYLSGVTSSTTNIASGGFQNNFGGGNNDAFIAKFNACAFFGPSITPVTATVCAGQSTTLSIIGGGTYLWSNGVTASSINVSPTQTTTYTVTVTSPIGCSATASTMVNIFNNTAASIKADGIAAAIDTIACGDVVQLQLTGSLNATPNIQWSPNTAISSTTIANPLVYPTTTTTYTVTFTNTNGCQQTASIQVYVKPIPNIGSISITTPSGTISLLDTLVVNVQLANANGLYSLYAKLRGDSAVNAYLSYAGYTIGTLLGTGGQVISTPPVVTGNVYDFGITKVGAVPGYSGSGVFYTFKFVTKNVTIPNNTNFCFYLDNISAYNTFGTPTGLTNQGPYCYTFTNQINVWPGDLNNSKTVTTADLLPIGYFYNSTGPARANATIQWLAQPATLWGYGQTYPNGSVYKVFADSNGDGIVSNADQAAIGFNMGKIHAMPQPNHNNEERASDGGLVVTPATVNINPQSLPQTLTFDVSLNNSGGLSALYGISVNLLFDNNVFDLTTATVDYTGSIFGNAGTDCLVINYTSDSVVSAGLTRYANAAINGQGLLFKVTLQTRSSIPGINTSQVLVYADAVNNQTGDPLIVDQITSAVTVGTASAISDLEEQNTITVYPNPATDMVYVHIKGNNEELKGGKVYVCNSTGQLVSEEKLQGSITEISTQTWGAAGLYTIEISSSTKQTLYKGKLVTQTK